MAGMRLEIRLKPRAGRDRIVLNAAGGADIAVTSPAIEDRANDHAIRLLADRLGVPRSSITIIRGRHARSKVVDIAGMDRDTALRKLET
jgi:uncharacterized protein